MKIKEFDELELITFEDENYFIYFSTGKNGASFNTDTSEGKNNFEKLREMLNVKEIINIKQVHSDLCLDYNEIKDELCVIEGDGIYTNIKDISPAVYTADCVPVIVTFGEYNIILAVHSGWKGTLKGITGKGISKVKEKYGIKECDIKVYIGPHNRECCYEVSSELISEFTESDIFKDNKDEIHDLRMLNLEKCIEIDAKKNGASEVISTKECTFCSKSHEYNSYRKGCSGRRQISGVIIK